MQDEAKIHNFPATIVARVVELEASLKTKEKRCQDAYESVAEDTRRVEKDIKLVVKRLRSCQCLKALKDKVFRSEGATLGFPPTDYASHV